MSLWRLDPRERLLPIALVYLPIPLIGAIFSFVYDVGATPEGEPTDVFLRGSPLTPPLFLPALLCVAGLLARRGGATGKAGAGFAGLVGLAFLAGSTLNLPNDLDAARAAGSPVPASIVLAILHAGLGVALATTAVQIFRKPATEPSTTRS